MRASVFTGIRSRLRNRLFQENLPRFEPPPPMVITKVVDKEVVDRLTREFQNRLEESQRELEERLQREYQQNMELELREKLRVTQKELHDKFQKEFEEKLQRLEKQEQPEMDRDELIQTLQEQVQVEKKLNARLTKLKFDVEQELVSTLAVERSRTAMALEELQTQRRRFQEELERTQGKMIKVRKMNNPARTHRFYLLFHEKKCPMAIEFAYFCRTMKNPMRNVKLNFVICVEKWPSFAPREIVFVPSSNSVTKSTRS